MSGGYRWIPARALVNRYRNIWDNAASLLVTCDTVKPGVEGVWAEYIHIEGDVDNLIAQIAFDNFPYPGVKSVAFKTTTASEKHLNRWQKSLPPHRHTKVPYIPDIEDSKYDCESLKPPVHFWYIYCLDEFAICPGGLVDIITNANPAMVAYAAVDTNNTAYNNKHRNSFMFTRDLKVDDLVEYLSILEKTDREPDYQLSLLYRVHQHV
jgi:hypothetical protein